MSDSLTVTSFAVLCYGRAQRRPHTHRCHLRLLGRAREREVESFPIRAGVVEALQEDVINDARDVQNRFYVAME